MKKQILILFVAFLILSSLTYNTTILFDINNDTPLWEVMNKLGEPSPNHVIDQLPSKASVEIGENIVLYGHAKSVRRQSAHFVCTSCHNIQQEDPNLTVADPQARLEYANEKGIPFLQATTLYGAVNRTNFYNDDYEKKYGDLVKPTRNNLREAIQLCAVECSQGRRLKDWELESVLAYLWTLEFKLGDLQLSNVDMESIQNALDNNKEKRAIVEMLKGKYLQGSPAHFVDPPGDRKKGHELTGNPANGKLVYELSCQHCHKEQRYSFYNMDDSKMTFKHLKKHISRYNRYSVYEVTRYGAPSRPGKRAYMPQYTKERMSDQQLEDLRAYIEQEAR